MKKNHFHTAIAIFLSVSMALSSCKKDNKIEGKGDTVLEFDHFWANASFKLNQDFVTASNQTVKFTKLKYLTSNYVFVREDGTEYAVPESYYLTDVATPSTLKLSIKNIPAGNYKGIQFIVGVDSARNTSGAQEGALATTNDLYWNWNTGYVFLKAEGTSPQNPMGFTYHIGGFKTPHAAQRTITFDFGSERLKVRKDKEVVIHAKVDVKKLFNNIDVSSLTMVHMPGPNAMKLADNYATMYSFEHLHN
jgi:hypothetical protein